MSEYKRLTKKGGYTKDLDLKQELGYSHIYNRLAELEDKIEDGTLIELPYKLGTKLYFIVLHTCCPYFVDSIKDLINSLTISQRKFCKKAGIDRTTIYNIMHDVHTPSNLTIKRICTYFGVDYRNYLRSRDTHY